MPDHTKTLGRWLDRSDALQALGLPESQFVRLIRAGLIEAHGSGRGERFDAETVYACARLWRHLEPMLPPLEKRRQG